MAHYFAKAGFKPDQQRIPRGQSGGGQWTNGGGGGAGTPRPAPYDWGDAATLEKHVRTHGKDFGVSTEKSYARKAQQFYQKAKSGKLPAVVDKYGVFRAYDPATNTFGAYNPDGTTRTYYKPRAGVKYFQNQINMHTAQGGRVINPLPNNIPNQGSIGRGGGGVGGIGNDNRLTIIKPKIN